MISYAMPFPPISWYLYALQHATNGKVYIDLTDVYAKMSYRNRYYITGSQGVSLMSIPIANGRNQRKPIADIMIDANTAWQVQHWKTITSYYRRAPFFEYTAPYFEPLFTKTFASLADFNQAAMQVVHKLLKSPYELVFVKDPADLPTDLEHNIIRILKPQQLLPGITPITYWQVFSDRCGFQEDLSILDYIFNEGIHLK